MCESPATSREHVPPRCLFPDDPTFRKDLIKVPSCDVHNLRKSKDDELLRHILASAPGNNEHCLAIIERGVIPAFERRPQFWRLSFRILREFRWRIQDCLLHNRPGPIRIIHSVDRPRIIFAETAKKLEWDLTVVWVRSTHLGSRACAIFPVDPRLGATFAANETGLKPTISVRLS
jgi:hypothetical protein